MTRGGAERQAAWEQPRGEMVSSHGIKLSHTSQDSLKIFKIHRRLGGMIEWTDGRVGWIDRREATISPHNGALRTSTAANSEASCS